MPPFSYLKTITQYQRNVGREIRYEIQVKYIKHI